MARNDFNGDGRSDVLWLLNENQAVSNWLSKPTGGFIVNDANAYADLGAFHTYDFVATGDFNGDGRSDVLWKMDDGTFFTVRQAGEKGDFPTAQTFELADTAWRVIGAGDFNGDKIDDLLWRHQDGTLSNWLGKAGGGFTVNDHAAKTYVPNAWTVTGVGDFNGDGRDDLLWQGNGYSSNWLGTENGGYVNNDAHALVKGSIWPQAIGDFNGDGRDDIVTGDDWGSFHANEARADGSFDLGGITYDPFAYEMPGWWIAATGDYNGDGVDDLLWRHEKGAVSNWLGLRGDKAWFEVNDAEAYMQVSTKWQVADLMFF
jgi:hypothetical protein